MAHRILDPEERRRISSLLALVRHHLEMFSGGEPIYCSPIAASSPKSWCTMSAANRRREKGAKH